MKKKISVMLLAMLAALCLCFGLAACGGGGNQGGPGGTPSAEEYTVTYDANGGAFADGETTFTQTVKSGSKLTAPASPARSNYTFAGWAKSKSGSAMWKFDEDTMSEDTTLYAQWSQESAVILSVDGASIEDRKIFMVVERDTSTVSLSGKIVCSDGSIWRLYSDPDGQREIPTKIVSNLTGGNNQYYIVVSSQDQSQVNVYELTVHRSYAVTVSYCDGETLLETAETYTGEEFTANYKPAITGYAFHGWKKQDGSAFTAEVLWAPLSLYADKTANTYQVTLNVNKGDALTETNRTMTYDSAYSFPVPTRTGYSFAGWYAENTQLTDASGASLAPWQFAEARVYSVVAHWEANEYTVTLEQNDGEAGSVAGGGGYAYDSRVTIKATTNEGYNFLGWYDTDGELVSENESYTFTMGFDVNYTAQWDYYTITTTSNVDYGSFYHRFTDEKVSVGTTVTLAVRMLRVNTTFLGWYKGEELVSKELSFQYTMTRENVTFEARWMQCPITVSSSGDGGVVDSLPDPSIIGQEITLKATLDLGYIWDGWYLNGEQVTTDRTVQFTVGTETAAYEARWALDPNMKSFRFTSTPTICEITEATAGGELIIPDYVTRIAKGALSRYSSYITSLTLPFVGETAEENTYLGYLFGASTSDDNVRSVPANLKTLTVTAFPIENYALYRCTGIENITIGDGVTSIGDYAFAGCSRLTSMEISDNVTSIGNCAFNACDELKSVTIGGGVTSIESYVFSGCSSLTSITIPDGVTSIGDYAFSRCSGLTDIQIPDSVTSIGRSAFSDTAYSNDDSNWENGTVLYIGDYLIEARSSISGDYTIRDNTKVIADEAFYGCKGLTGVTIPDGVTSIGDQAFFLCSGLKSVTIGSGVTSIGDQAFYGTAYYNDDSNWENGTVLYIGDYLIKAIVTISGNYSIRDNTKVIANEAFDNCSGLTGVTIPDGLTSIGALAFYGCNQLTSIEIPDSVTSIGNYAFDNCSGLKSVTIGSGVTSIGYQAFYAYSGLKTVYYKGTAETWNNISIGENNSKLTNAARYYFSEGEPDEAKWQESENWWHYDDETGEIVIWKKENA